MWKKPKIESPSFEPEVFCDINQPEIIKLNGGNVGTCCGAGYTCNTSKGSFKIGTCLVVGFSQCELTIDECKEKLVYQMYLDVCSNEKREI